MSNLLCDIFGHSPRTEYNAELSGYSNCWHRTRCRRCGLHLDTPSKKHEWVEETLESPCQTQKKCRNCGYTSGLHPLPIGLQIAGPRFDDLGVLQVARAFEQIRPPQKAWPQPPRI